MEGSGATEAGDRGAHEGRLGYVIATALLGGALTLPHLQIHARRDHRVRPVGAGVLLELDPGVMA